MNKSSIKKKLAPGYCCVLLLTSVTTAYGQASSEDKEGASTSSKMEYIKFGDMNSWLTRNVKESGIIGGQTKLLYEVAPNGVWNEAKEYTNQGGSPWATSNVMAKVCGITKTNTSVYKEMRPGEGFCARLETHIEKCVVLGIVDIKVLAAGSLYLGEMIEPITSTSNPMSKIKSGIPFTRKPRALCFDYRVKLSGQENRIKQTGFSKVSQVKGIDMADCVLYLQKRWEDSNGNIYASRIGTMVCLFNRSTNTWVNDAQFPIHYGNISNASFYNSFMSLKDGDEAGYAMNSKGRMVPIRETTWGSAGDTPTHLQLQFCSSHGGAYIGSPGNTFWIDNVRLVY